MTISILTSAPRALLLPAVASGVAPTATRLSPFEPGAPVLVSSVGAADVVGAAIKRFDAATHLQFRVATAAVTPASYVVGQSGTFTAGLLTTDLTVTLGGAGGRLAWKAGAAIAAMTATVAADHLAVIVTVDGVPYKRITDATGPNPAAGQWGFDTDTDAGFTIVLGFGGNLVTGALVELFVGQNIGSVAKLTGAAGAALVAGGIEERVLGVPVAGTDPMGRATTRIAESDFVMSNTAVATVFSLAK